ncbi:MAG: hypothetical protein WD068_01325 [Candidatus Babeliales bacterium]
MKKKLLILGLTLAGSRSILGCATCVGLAEKSPELPKNEVYVQLKKKKHKKKRSKDYTTTLSTSTPAQGS